MTFREALEFIIPFGKYQGEKVGIVYGDDKRYLKWLYESISSDEKPELYDALSLVIEG